MAKIKAGTIRRDILAEIIGETIQEVGVAPEGTLYAAVMGTFSLSEFNAAVAVLVERGTVRKTGFLLEPVG